eukprot:TRINITY_DN18445_c0_g1_i2.p1 TRINITY_DN18445_c0_g1~~TRINITY_DN18445_c0_g1_i2.p1  ORF type:complete len:205 (-),score=40.02 TRINITY_DN18445_c0_g1_i2:89-703(-)
MSHVFASACMLLSVSGAEGVALRGMSPVGAIAETMQKMPLAAVMDDSGFFGNATAFLDGLKDKEAPGSAFKLTQVDPQPAVGFFSCTRDTDGCPEGFTEGGENTQVCVPDSSYRGPCGTPLDLSSMTDFAKARWADACQASWPCSDCTRDYSGCPVGWTRPADAQRCEPPANYVGACDTAEFGSDSIAELESWASSCGAVWPCM